MIHTQHLPSDDLGTDLDGYRRLVPLDFANDSVRAAAAIWAQVAVDFITSFTRADIERYEQLDALNDGIGDILVRLNEYPPPALPPTA